MFQEQGISYCNPVQGITYENMGSSGQYNEVIDMDDQSGECKFAPRQFSGPLAPFNEPHVQ
ncbi:target of Sbf [Collariella sp. IMI 366227]|nr:target of Sbf [Collariella sp. IMI 366227]